MTQRLPYVIDEKDFDGRCGTCDWWVKFYDEPHAQHNRGECRRFPPALSHIATHLGNKGYRAWPMTEAKDFCGEWRREE